MRRVAIFVAVYLIVAVALGLAFSWAWAAVVVLMGLIPAGAMWISANKLGESYLDWGQESGRSDRNNPH